jgi:hypothetical protein
MRPDAPQGRLLGPYSRLSTLFQFFIIGEDIVVLKESFKEKEKIF